MQPSSLSPSLSLSLHSSASLIPLHFVFQMRRLWSACYWGVWIPAVTLGSTCCSAAVWCSSWSRVADVITSLVVVSESTVSFRYSLAHFSLVEKKHNPKWWTESQTRAKKLKVLTKCCQTTAKEEAKRMLPIPSVCQLLIRLCLSIYTASTPANTTFSSWIQAADGKWMQLVTSIIYIWRRGGSRIFVRGVQQSFDPKGGALSPKFAQNTYFPLKLPESCMILKKKTWKWQGNVLELKHSNHGSCRWWCNVGIISLSASISRANRDTV